MKGQHHPVTKQELQALASAVTFWHHCLPPEQRNKGKEHRDITAMHDRVRLARGALKKLRAAADATKAAQALTQRERFEQWILCGRVGELHRHVNDPEKYASTTVQRLWVKWQAEHRSPA